MSKLTHSLCAVAVLFCYSAISFSQEVSHASCLEAKNICALGDYHFSNFSQNLVEEDLALEGSPLKETNSLWLKFRAENSGDLSFIILPNQESDDIDFVLYESSDDCDSKQPLRIMTSGIMLGSKKKNNCLGQIGLTSKSSDTHESEGCYGKDDGFLKSASLNHYDTYYLFINNYDSDSGITILFEGNNGLKLRDDCNGVKIEHDYEVYPNPTSDILYVSPTVDTGLDSQVQIIDPSGKVVYDISLEEFIEPHSIEVDSYAPGNYLVRLIDKEQVSLKSFFKH